MIIDFFNIKSLTDYTLFDYSFMKPRARNGFGTHK